ncbi:DNA topoisomerase (ATP-hydrolyzing) subunit A [Vibrio gazogenes]|uniref:DNA gyrase subunit A n=1 Tax=Vibrio gazogenes TaxID=687 RepID=A0A1Z2SB14_VIBGA|nr:DNA topoisomerase (ATP-hydrolyzing) subunit A [Vibrio gazogenes]ASA54362.1 DNA gyrase subunit A [Vibrio gazogenes]
MSDLAKEITPVSIEDELRGSYLDYAMSVIVGRALPDARDGLKPVHRRVLYAMSVLGNDWNKPYKKSARVVGDVIGKYHPHGDSAVYDTIVRMAQPFSLRYMLVDGQGNFGSIDGDSAAAMRYTEVRMAKISHELLADLDKETVDYVSNYDDTEQIPAVLPTKVPNLLVNGASGIAVGMATNIPPHNLGEVIDGCLAFIDNEDITIDELLEYIPGPDFPTAAMISGRKGIIDAYKTGRGKIYLRSKADIESDKNGRETIVVTEIPYQVNKARLIEKIAELVKDKKVEGISALRDESDKDGMRIVIECKRDAVGEVVLNNLYSQTQLQTTFGINMVALDNGQPKLFNLKELLKCFVNHRREVVTRRTIFELRKARDRAHILEGLALALANIDDIIELIRRAPTPAEAKAGLLARGWSLGDVAAMLERAGVDSARPDWLEPQYGIRDGLYFLTEQQAQAILELRLHRLTGLEHEKILDEYKGLLEEIAELMLILSSTERLMEVIREELETIRNGFGDNRLTEITAASHDIDMEELIAREDVVVTLSHERYVKYQSLSDYESQRRGGKGKSATKMKDEDYIERLLVANTHDNILCFSTRGKTYRLKVYQLPHATRTARGKPINNILPLEENERITAILRVAEYAADKFIFMATGDGTVKKTPLDQFANVRSNGLIAVNLRDDDSLIGVDITDGNSEIMLFSKFGKVVRFKEAEEIAVVDENGQPVLDENGQPEIKFKGVRPMGRTASGVRGMKLADGDQVVSLIVPKTDGDVLTVTENGYGKRTSLSEYPTKGRGTQGVVSIKVSERNGSVVGAVQVDEGDEFMMITNAGTLVRTRVGEVSQVGRNTQGVTLIRTSEDEKVVGLQRIEEVEDADIDIDIESEGALTGDAPEVSSSDVASPNEDDLSDEQNQSEDD